MTTRENEPGRLLRSIGSTEIAETTAASRRVPRRRVNLNLHRSAQDQIQRLMHVFQPGSYVRPHRHDGDRFEVFTLLAGRAAMMLFDDSGETTEMEILSTEGVRIVEVPGGAWHTLFALEPDTVLFEVKCGPFRPMTDKDFGPWAPAEGAPGVVETMARWMDRVNGT